MLLIIISGLVVLFAAISFAARPYRTGEKPITFSTVVDVPSDEVELVYDKVRDALPSFLKETYEIEPDGTLVTTAHVPFSDGSDEPLFVQRCEKIGGTELCPIYRVFDTDGTPYPAGEGHYAVSAFAPLGDKTVLTIEERVTGVSVIGFLVVWFIIKRTLAAQVRMLNHLVGGEHQFGREGAVHSQRPSEPNSSSPSSFNATAASHKQVQPELKSSETPKATLAPGSANASVIAREDRDFLERHKNELILSLVAVASFMLMFGPQAGLLLVPLILLHEYGHLLGYQLTGQKGNRLMLVPFFGGLAIANEAHKSEFNRAFCALMGPAICAPASIALAIAAVSVGSHWSWWWLTYAAMLCSMGNALNMVPMMPFDGGHIMQSVARSLSRAQAQAAMMVMSAGGGLILMQAGYENFAYITFAWLATAMFQSEGEVAEPTTLNLKGGLTIAGMYAMVLACHVGTALFVYGRFY